MDVGLNQNRIPEGKLKISMMQTFNHATTIKLQQTPILLKIKLIPQKSNCDLTQMGVNREILVQRALVLLHMRKYTDAINDLDKALKIKWADPEPQDIPLGDNYEMREF